MTDKVMADLKDSYLGSMAEIRYVDIAAHYKGERREYQVSIAVRLDTKEWMVRDVTVGGLTMLQGYTGVDQSDEIQWLKKALDEKWGTKIEF